MRLSKLLGAAGAALLLLAAVLGTTSSAASANSVTARTKSWTVTLAISRSTLKAGTKMPATLTFVNKTGHLLVISGCATDATFGVGLAKPGTPYSPISGAIGCRTTLRPGTTVLRRNIYASLATGGNLPTGRYHTVIEWNSTPHQLPHPGSLYVLVTT
jgi:hypothetical protein